MPASGQRILLFANPISGRGQSVDIAHTIEQRLRGAGMAVVVCLSRPEQQPLEPSSVDAVVVVGGDGTLREVAAWMMSRAVKDAAALVPLLVVPVGTANLMGRHLGIHWSWRRGPHLVLQALRRQRLMQLDVAWSSAGPCLLVAGVGFDGAVVHELARLRRGTITRLDYAQPLLRAAWQYRYPPLSVSVDGRNICRDRRAMVFVGNVPEYGTGFALLPAARPDDGLLDVCVVPCNSLVHLASLLLRAMVGRLATAPGAVYVKGRTVSIESSVAVPAQIDGEAAGCTPLQIELLPQRLPMLCPPAADAGY